MPVLIYNPEKICIAQHSRNSIKSVSHEIWTNKATQRIKWKPWTESWIGAQSCNVHRTPIIERSSGERENRMKTKIKSATKNPAINCDSSIEWSARFFTIARNNHFRAIHTRIRTNKSYAVEIQATVLRTGKTRNNKRHLSFSPTVRVIHRFSFGSETSASRNLHACIFSEQRNVGWRINKTGNSCRRLRRNCLFIGNDPRSICETRAYLFYPTFFSTLSLSALFCRVG